MELVFYPASVLKRRAEPLREVDDVVRERIREMFEVMYQERGVGLAAPQVGWSTRLFVVNSSGEPDAELERVYINPEILEAYGEDMDEEGCLSIPGVRAKVQRHQRIVMRAQDSHGDVFEESLEALDARVVQHELDHLDGILFTSRLSAGDRLLVGKTLKQLEREYKKAQPR